MSADNDFLSRDPARPDDVDNELLEDFKEEASEHLQIIESSLLRLEQNPKELQLVHTIFGPMHSIKGGANYLGLSHTATLAHSMENLLAKLRKGEMQISRDVIEALLKGTDFIKKLLNEIMQQGWEKSSAKNMVEMVNQVLGGGKLPTNAVPPTASSKPAVAQPVASKTPAGPIASKPAITIPVFADTVQAFWQQYKTMMMQIHSGLEQLRRNPTDQETAKKMAAYFHDIQSQASFWGFNRTAEISEFAEKACLGLSEKKIKNVPYLLTTLGDGVMFLEKLAAEISESGSEKSDLRVLISAFARIEFADAVAYDPESEFWEETAQYFKEIQQNLKAISLKGYQIHAYEDIKSAFSNFKGVCLRLGYVQLANLATTMEIVAKMLLLGDLELFPRIDELFVKAIAVTNNSLAVIKKERRDVADTSVFVQEINQLVALRKKILGKKIPEKVVKDTEKTLKNFYELLADLEKNRKTKYLIPLKKALGTFEQYMINKEVEYYWTAIQFLLEKIDLLEANKSGKVTPEEIVILLGTLQEIEDLVIRGKGEAVLEEERILRESLPLKDRIKFIPGMTADRFKSLLKLYNTVETIQKATVEGLTQIEGITPIMAKRIIAEFKVARETLPEEASFKDEIDNLIGQREGLEDEDCDKELVTIFVDHTTDTLHKMVQTLVAGESLNPNIFRQQYKTLLQSLLSSSNYMGYAPIIQIVEQDIALLEKIPPNAPVGQLEIEKLRQRMAKIANLLPISISVPEAPELSKTVAQPDVAMATADAVTAADSGEAQQEIEPEIEPVAPAVVNQKISIADYEHDAAPAAPAEFFSSQEPAVASGEGERMDLPNKPILPEGADEKQEMLKIFIAHVEDDIDLLMQFITGLQANQSDLSPIREIHKIIKNFESAASQLNFQDLSLFLMKELNNLEETLGGSPLTNDRIEHLKETMSRVVDFILELKGEEVEPQLPPGYFDPDELASRTGKVSSSQLAMMQQQVAQQANSAKLFEPSAIIETSVPTPMPRQEAKPISQPVERITAKQKIEPTATAAPKQETPAMPIEVSDDGPKIADTVVTTTEANDVAQPEATSLPESLPEREGDTPAPKDQDDQTPVPKDKATGTAASDESDSSHSVDAVKEDMQSHTLRVNSQKVDELMNLVGELVVNRASFDLLSQDIKVLYRQFVAAGIFSKEQARDFKHLLGRMEASSSELGRVANELQGGVMQVRMVPMEVLFKRFPRIIRELSKRTGKMVKLDISGETTELDKIVIEEITDPLVHIMRNMLDHGIELPDERRKKGKPPYGTIEISAYHEGNQVVIELVDDGKGIDCEAIRKRIVELQMTTQQEAARMSEADLVNMLYRAGFSMKEQASMMSGRGVGMSVVKTNITKIGGTIEIETEVDAFTCFTIKIPLTLAIIQALLVKVANATYCIPISSVREVVKINKTAIYSLDGQQVIRIRDRVIPLLNPCKVFHLPGATDEAMEFVVVIHTGHRESGLLVNKLLGGQDIVIKSLMDDLVISPGVSGATLLGDGTVSLILDIPGFMHLAQDSERRAI